MRIADLHKRWVQGSVHEVHSTRKHSGNPDCGLMIPQRDINGLAIPCGRNC